MIYSYTFANGLRLVAEPRANSASVSFELFVAAGSLNEPAHILGASSVLESWLYRGAGLGANRRDARALFSAFDDLGLTRDGGAEMEGITFGASLLSEDLAATLALFSDVVTAPHLPEAEFAACLDLARSNLESLEDSPDEKLFYELYDQAFLSEHGRSSLGTKAGLKNLNVKELLRDYASRFSPEGAVLAVAGGLDWDELLALVTELFGAWQGQEITQSVVTHWREPTHKHIETDIQQVQIGLLFPGLAFLEPGWYEYRILMSALSGLDASSRLFESLREQHGLVYEVSANDETWRATSGEKSAGAIGVFAATGPAKANQALALLQQEFLRLKDGVAEEELLRARASLASRIVMAEASTRARAGMLRRDVWLGGRARPTEELRRNIMAVSLESLNAFLHDYNFGQPQVLTLGPNFKEG